MAFSFFFPFSCFQYVCVPTCVRASVCACDRACVRASVCACVHACVCACVRVCMCACLRCLPYKRRKNTAKEKLWIIFSEATDRIILITGGAILLCVTLLAVVLVVTTIVLFVRVRRLTDRPVNDQGIMTILKKFWYCRTFYLANYFPVFTKVNL